MGYMHIDNLYKNQDILMFKQCYALEKIHGTSAHISIKDLSPEDADKVEVKFFSGGEKHVYFMSLFDVDKLEEVFKKLELNTIILYGETYGGSQQGMSATYGKDLKFIVFDVKIDNKWLSVPQAESLVKEFGLEFVDYIKVDTDLTILDACRDTPSTQAIRNGVQRNMPREGIVLRPLIELIKNNGKRIICKHKGDTFKETTTKRKVIDPDKLKVLSEAKEIAEEWVTQMRLVHVLDKFKNPSMENTREIIKAMSEDITREGKGEIIFSREAFSAIGARTVKLLKEYLSTRKENEKI